MVVVTFADEQHRTDAFLILTMRFGSVEIAGRWMRLRVTGAMVETLIQHGIPFTMVSESQIMAEQKEVESGSRLYDLLLRDYPSERGAAFRSVQVFECRVCGALSNRVVKGGFPEYGISVICPNSDQCWHHEMEDKCELLRQICLACELLPQSSHIISYKEEFAREVLAFRNQYAAEIQCDVRGTPDMGQKRPVTKVRGYKRGACEHFK